MSQDIPFVDYDYRHGFGDRLLSIYRSLAKNAEKRHQNLELLARKAKWIPGFPTKALPALETVIPFADKSNSLHLSSPIILAAGANKTAEYISDYANLGFGGITVGTATRNARSGNSYRPRVHTLEKDRGITNSMGLNNPGIDVIARRVDRNFSTIHKRGLSVGISIAETPGEEDEDLRLEETVYSFRKAYITADYVEINVSCPNTGAKRIDSSLQFLNKLMGRIMGIRTSIAVKKAVFAKLSPDMGEKQLHATLDILKSHGINGLILFNTFPAEKSQFLNLAGNGEDIIPLRKDQHKGGLSGRPLYVNTFRAVEYIHKRHPEMEIIASGGIDHGKKVWDLLRLGASAVQVYSVVAFRWKAIHAMNRELLECIQSEGFKDMDEFLEHQRAERNF